VQVVTGSPPRARSPGVRRKSGPRDRPADVERREAAAAVDVAEGRGAGGAEVEPRCWHPRGRGRPGIGLRDAARERGVLLRHARHAADERRRGRARDAAVGRGVLVAAAEAAAFPGLALRAGQAGAGNS
jgi:hypothetical protein